MIGGGWTPRNAGLLCSGASLFCSAVTREVGGGVGCMGGSSGMLEVEFELCSIACLFTESPKTNWKIKQCLRRAEVSAVHRGQQDKREYARACGGLWVICGTCSTLLATSF